MDPKTLNVNGREFTMVEIPALPAARLLIKIQKFVLPAIPKGGQLLDLDISVLAKSISDTLDEVVIDEAVIPMFALCGLRTTIPGEKDPRILNSEAQINFVFPKTVDLADLIELVKAVFEAQFSDFLELMMRRFGLEKIKPEEDPDLKEYDLEASPPTPQVQRRLAT